MKAFYNSLIEFLPFHIALVTVGILAMHWVSKK